MCFSFLSIRARGADFHSRGEGITSSKCRVKRRQGRAFRSLEQREREKKILLSFSAPPSVVIVVDVDVVVDVVVHFGPRSRNSRPPSFLEHVVFAFWNSMSAITSDQESSPSWRRRGECW